METLLLLHGWGGNADSWRPVADFFAHTYRVLVPEFACPPAAVYTLDDYADDLTAYLQQKQVTRCVVVAHSFGARLVAVMNTRQPQLFTKIVITGGAGLRTRSPWVGLKIFLYKIGKLLGKSGGGSADYRDLTPNGKVTFQNLVNRDLTREIKTVTAPTLIIHGARDTAVPLRHARRWAKLTRGQLKIYAGNGHFAYLESLARFLNDVREFLRG